MSDASSSLQRKHFTLTLFTEAAPTFEATTDRYLVYQREICPETSRPHWQAYLALKKPCRFRTLQKRFPGAHIEAANGTPEQNKAYCTKAETRAPGCLPVEHGTAPVRARTRTDLANVLKRIRDEGESYHSLLVSGALTNYQALRYAEKVELALKKPRVDPPEVYWFHGPPGSGKTRAAVALGGDDYWMSAGDLKWFDGYQGQRVAIFDDFRPSDCSFSFLLRLLDRYRLKVPIKGSFVEWTPRVIIITTVDPPHVLFHYKTTENLEQLTRRLTECRPFENRLAQEPGI